MPELEQLDAIKSFLIGAWDAPFRRDEEATGGTQLQSLHTPMPPRGGLAIGHGVDEQGELQLEFRVAASGGPDLQRAERIAAHAREQGIKTALLKLLGTPRIPQGPPVSQAAPKMGGRRQPLHIGASVAHEMGFAGTLGAFVTLDSGSTGILSCAHVLAEAPRTRIRIGDPIQQPGQPDQVPVGNRIGTLSKHFSRYIASRTDNLDVAVAEIDPEVPLLGNVVPDYAPIPDELRGKPIGAPLTRDEVTIGTSVFKVGRTSGVTYGTLSAADFQNFRPEFVGRKRVTFGRVHEVMWPAGGPDFTEGGDSGSLVLTRDGLRPVGIHFCIAQFEGGDFRSYMIPWDRVVAEFPIQLLAA